MDDNVASEFVSGAMAVTAQTKVEAHLAGCRDCRALVAALAGDDANDSNVATLKHERLTESQAGKLPVLSIGDRVGRYLVLSTLGTGGMGQVFAAYDPQLDRKIALKVLRANLGANAQDARKRLKREAQAIAQLNHPNVVAVYDVGTTDNGEDVYIAMEFVEGDTLTTWLKRWPRTWREILEIFHQAARGLMAAHSVGLLHRDFKPDNVLVGSDGRVRVTDFGLARSLFGIDDSNRGGVVSPELIKPDGSPLLVDLTATGTVLGTPRYMPPEQLTGPNIDARSDQFSFCVALYEALYGSHPLAGATSVKMLEQGTPATPPPEASRVPQSVARAVMRGLEKERTKRFPTLAALVTELNPPLPRSRAKFAAVGAIALALVGGATAAVMASRHDPIIKAPPPDEETVRVLVDHINQLETEVRTLRKQVLQGRLDHETDIKQIERTNQLVEQKENEIHLLTDKVLELRKQRALPSRASSEQAVQVTAAVASAQHDLEGCFDEWAQRPLDVKDVGSHPSAPTKPHPTDSDVIVTLEVTPDGIGNSPKARGEDTDRSPSLEFCVTTALARVHYPPGPEILSLEVDIAWAAPDIISTSARVIGRREAKSSNLDLH